MRRRLSRAVAALVCGALGSPCVSTARADGGPGASVPVVPAEAPRVAAARRAVSYLAKRQTVTGEIAYSKRSATVSPLDVTMLALADLACSTAPASSTSGSLVDAGGRIAATRSRGLAFISKGFDAFVTKEWTHEVAPEPWSLVGFWHREAFALVLVSRLFGHDSAVVRGWEDAVVASVLSRQRPDGGFGSYSRGKAEPSDEAATAYALMILTSPFAPETPATTAKPTTPPDGAIPRPK